MKTMIPAKIIEISDKVVVEYGETIAEVENVNQGKITKRWYAEIRIFLEDKLSYIEPKKLSLNQQVFIEPTSEGKCKIVKI